VTAAEKQRLEANKVSATPSRWAFRACIKPVVTTGSFQI